METGTLYFQTIEYAVLYYRVRNSHLSEDELAKLVQAKIRHHECYISKPADDHDLVNGQYVIRERPPAGGTLHIVTSNDPPNK